MTSNEKVIKHRVIKHGVVNFYYHITPLFITPCFITPRFTTPCVLSLHALLLYVLSLRVYQSSPYFTTPLHSRYYYMPKLLTIAKHKLNIKYENLTQLHVWRIILSFIRKLRLQFGFVINKNGFMANFID